MQEPTTGQRLKAIEDVLNNGIVSDLKGLHKELKLHRAFLLIVMGGAFTLAITLIVKVL